MAFKNAVSGLLIAFMVLSFSVLSYKRNYKWQNEIRLWGDTVKKSPMKGRPYFKLGTAYYNLKDYNKALNCYLRSIKLEPKYDVTYFNVAFIYMIHGKSDLAIKYFKDVLRINPNYPQAQSFLNYLEKGMSGKKGPM